MLVYFIQVAGIEIEKYFNNLEKRKSGIFSESANTYKQSLGTNHANHCTMYMLIKAM